MKVLINVISLIKKIFLAIWKVLTNIISFIKKIILAIWNCDKLSRIVEIVVLLVAISTLLVNCIMLKINNRMLKIMSKMPDVIMEIDDFRSKVSLDTLYLSFRLTNTGEKVANNTKITFLIDSSYIIYYDSVVSYLVQKPTSKGKVIVIQVGDLEPYCNPYITGIIIALNTKVLDSGSGDVFIDNNNNRLLRYKIRTDDTTFIDSVKIPVQSDTLHNQ